MCKSVRDQIPAKQGLKLTLTLKLSITLLCSRSNSSKTRIETLFFEGLYDSPVTVRDQIPAKQGLKHDEGDKDKLIGVLVRDQIPAKQGLKHNCVSKLLKTLYSSRSNSSKTRIETCTHHDFILIIFSSRSNSSKTRIETKFSFPKY